MTTPHTYPTHERSHVFPGRPTAHADLDPALLGPPLGLNECQHCGIQRAVSQGFKLQRLNPSLRVLRNQFRTTVNPVKVFTNDVGVE